MSKPEEGVCKSCKAPLLWVRTKATGSLMPLDAQPNPSGNVILDSEGLAVVLSGSLFEEAIDASVPHYMPHHATCPNAKKHRKPKS